MYFKILLVGDGDDGKTSFVDKFKPVRIDDTTSLVKLETNHGVISLEFLSVNMYEDADAEIIMFDLTRSMNVLNHIPQTTKPRVIVGNKFDLVDQIKVPDEQRYEKAKGYQYYDISVKSSYNIDKPLVYLLTKLMPNAADIQCMTN